MTNQSLKNFTMRATVAHVRVQVPAETLRRLLSADHGITSVAHDESLIQAPRPDTLLALATRVGDPAITGIAVRIHITPRGSLTTDDVPDRVVTWLRRGLPRGLLAYPRGSFVNAGITVSLARPWDHMLKPPKAILIDASLDRTAVHRIGLNALSNVIRFRFRHAFYPIFKVNHSRFENGQDERLQSHAYDVKANRRIGDALNKLQSDFGHEQLVIRHIVRGSMRPSLPKLCDALANGGVQISVPRRSALRFLPSVGSKLLLHARCEMDVASPS